MEQRSWGNRSSTLIRAGVLLKMSLLSLGDQVQQNTFLEKASVKISAAVQGVLSINVWLKSNVNVTAYLTLVITEFRKMHPAPPSSPFFLK